MNKDALARALAPLLRRIRTSVARGIISLINDASGHQTVQVVLRDGEPADDLERLQEYGFFSVPLAGAEALAVAVGGKQDHLVVACVADHRSRPKEGNAGDAGIYHYQGHEIRLEENGVARIKSKKLICEIEEEISMTAPDIILNANLKVTGETTLEGGANIGGIEFDEHRHKETNDVTEGPQ
ncbi:phage baseplate assembly protein V [Aeromonas piscicola]|uniref:phage baseplate assembly protein V n=1 Tax=Aeromonas piscicola TaxID=600645 RepID=UPI0009E52603|nr:phage baseplate assembly protein V [Aeromonas piscicola]